MKFYPSAVVILLGRKHVNKSFFKMYQNLFEALNFFICHFLPQFINLQPFKFSLRKLYLKTQKCLMSLKIWVLQEGLSKIKAWYYLGYELN